MTSPLRDRRVLALVVMTALVAVGVSAYFLWRTPRDLPSPGSTEYLAYQRAFQVGLAALDAGQTQTPVAMENLTLATELIPLEPAAWANLGLLRLRSNDLKQAAKDLQKARSLAPEDGAIESLLGHLAEKQGRSTEAVAHFRKAVEKAPNDLPALFTLAEAVSKESKTGSDVEYQHLMERILKIQPTNLPVLVKRAESAHRNKHQAALRDSLDQLTKLAVHWKPRSKERATANEYLDKLRQAVDSNSRDVPQLLNSLNNLLKNERGYLRDFQAIRPDADFVGSSLQQFIRLAPPRPTPALPDRELMFKIEPLPTVGLDDTRWDVIRPAWFINEVAQTKLVASATEGGLYTPPGEMFKLGFFVANAREVRRADGEGKPLPFPSGPKAIPPSPAGVLPIDWDNDFRIDLVLAGAGGLRFWQQEAGGVFVDVTGATDLPRAILDGDYYGVWAADIEMDGDLDIIAARRSGPPVLLRNNRDGTFKAIEIFPDVKDVRGFVWADLDNDGAPDAIYLDAAGKLHVYANDRSLQFTPRPLPNNIGSFRAITAADVNGDGVFDLVALRSDGSVVRISDKDRWQSWETAELARAAPPEQAAAIFVEDIDNNGAVDLIVTGPKLTQIFLGDESGKFVPVVKLDSLGALAVLDLNHDGKLDLLGLSAGKPIQAVNESKLKYRSQTVSPLANPKAGDNRINSFALGGEIEMRAGMLVQKRAIDGPVVHFGLGEQPAIDVIRIVWPNGTPQLEFNTDIDRFVIAGQRLSGSCPFLFTHDGEGIRFVGDFMWGTPLGMYVNGQNVGDFPQTTEWLKIRGEHLKPRDGYYDVRVHANLWEADYFDQLAMIVVDHPPDTEIHVDERFFLTPTPPKLYVTTPAKPVARAWDHHGKDATDEIRAIDGRYLDRAKRGRFQGVAEDHWVEIDLGDDAPKYGPVLLVARGWLHPTNSSINVALSQGKHAMPAPLSLEVPDGKAGWKTAVPALGFPAGKDKTMLIRLDGIDGNGVSRRLRLRTSMEIYWDFLGYATELSPTLAKLQRPEPTSVDLRYRGILEMTQKNRSSPEVPVYDKVTRGRQQYRDLAGYYTRYGDVRELVAKVDDRYAILNAGDEIAFRFPAPPAPADGWKRDFIWECDGWTRDGDLNTRFGNTVLPLPAHGVNVDQRRPTYLEDDPVFRRFPGDWQTYHTRYVSDYDFGRGLRR